ncbi:hypothetical protein [Terracidiphilus sp.]|uniref:hypothetical protein n=1 Tax=Terracidiphilus sp. TaxID=1964191 RepID=UPI003C1A1D2A
MLEEAGRYRDRSEPEPERSDWKRLAPILGAVVLAVAGFGYAIHEHNSAQTANWQNQQMATQLDTTHKQLDATNSQLNVLAAKVDALSKPSPAATVGGVGASGAPSVRQRRPAGMSDARWKKMQAQLDEQRKAIAATQTDLQTTRGDLDSAKTELGGSIAKTHDELVLLQKRGERSYYEFDLSKSKQYARTGPMSVSLRKANVNKGYADLQLIVDDHTLTQKHVNLFQPAMFYDPDSPQPMEIVINDITKDHIHGYISAPKYRKSELTAMASTNPAQGDDSGPVSANAQPATRQKLSVPKGDPNE